MKIDCCWKATLLAASLVAVRTAPAQAPAPLPTSQDTGTTTTYEFTGDLPGYDALRFQQGEETTLGNNFLNSLPHLEDADVVTSGTVFPEVPLDSPYSRLTMNRLIDVALEGNFRLQNSGRSVQIARSSTRAAESTFIPYADLVGDSRYRQNRDENATRVDGSGNTRNTTRETGTLTNRGGVETGVTLPSGAQVQLNGSQSRTDGRTSDGNGVAESDGYNSNADVRVLQPLLRGGGVDVATASLRRARIAEMDQTIGDQLARRDVVFSVISAYFQLLQTARSLQVSRDAIRERLRFLEETRIKFNVGRVDESEILRAEIQYLSELETAIGRRQSLDDQRENILLLLGLPLETPISFVDISDRLASRGRVDIPSVDLAVEEALANRMELMQADLTLTNAEISHKLALNDLLPQLDLDGGYGRSDSSSEYHNANGLENSAWDVGTGLRIPLVNIRRRESAKQSALSLESAKTNRLSVERELIQDVRRAHRSVLSTEAQLTLVSKNVEQARKTLALINGRFEVGFATITEVRLAQDDLFAAETRYSSTLLNYQVQLARLYVALGRPLF